MSKQTAQGSPDGPKYIYGKENVNWGGPKRASHSSPQGDVSSAVGDFSHSQGEQPVYTQKEALNTLRGDVLDNADEYDKTEEGARNRAIAQEFILESASKNSPKEVVEQIKKNIADGMNPVEAMESIDYKLSRPRSNKIDPASDKEIIYVGHPLNKRQNIYETNRKNPAIATTYELSWKDKVSSYDTYQNTGNKNEMMFTDRQHFLTIDAEKHGIHYHSPHRDPKESQYDNHHTPPFHVPEVDPWRKNLEPQNEKQEAARDAARKEAKRKQHTFEYLINSLHLSE